MGGLHRNQECRPRPANPFGMQPAAKPCAIALILLVVLLGRASPSSAAPGIGLDASALVFSGTAYGTIPPQTLSITNSGGSSLNYSIRSDTFWLSVNSPTGVIAAGAVATPAVRVAVRGLAPRVYRGTLTIADPAATNGPQTVAVSLSLGTMSVARAVVAWGSNNNGQTNAPAGLTNVSDVAGGGYHSLARCADGTVVAWGNNAFGQTNVPTSLTDAVAVAGGGYHSLALGAQGMVMAWGDNSLGQTNVPAGLTGVVAVAGGGYHSLALRADGTVVAWGNNSFGQTNVPAGLSNVVAVAAGAYHSLALRADGTVAAWGYNSAGQTNVPARLTNGVAVAGGGSHSLALCADGKVVAWGDNTYGQTNVPAGLTNAMAVGAGTSHSVALCGDGTVMAWGRNNAGQTNVPPNLSHFTAVAAGWDHSLALLPVASLVVTSPYGTPVPGSGTNIMIIGSVATCSVDSVVLVPSATQYVCTGWTGAGSVPAGGTSNRVVFAITNESAIVWLWSISYWVDVQTHGCGSVGPGSGWYAAGSNVTMTASNRLGQSLLGWDGDTNGCVANGATLTVPADGSRHITARFTQPALAVVATNLAFSGQVCGVTAPQFLVITNAGDGPLSYTVRSDVFWLSVDSPVGVLAAGAGTTQVVRVSTRGLSPGVYGGTLTLTAPAASNSPQTVAVGLRIEPLVVPPSLVMSWGTNGFGQATVPTGLTNAVAVAAGANHSLALRASGTVVAWGSNSYGQTTVPAVLSNAVAVAGGADFSLALRADGKVVAWGRNNLGQTNVPAGLTNVVAVAGGGVYSLALCRDGTVTAWGNNALGQTNVPVDLTSAVAVAAGSNHALALRADGSVEAWGDNALGQTNVSADLTNVVAVEAGSNHSLALRSDGTVVAWGDNGYGQTNVPTDLTDVVLVSAGANHSLALRADGTVVAWGDGSCGQTNVPTDLTNVVAVAGGGGHSLALAPSASLVVVSAHGSLVPGQGTNWVIRNTPQTCAVTPSLVSQGTTQYVCAGWAGTGSMPASGTSNQVAFTITNNSTVTWLWTTNYWLDVQPDGCGNVGQTSGWYAAGSNVTLTASNWPGYSFWGWHGDTNGCAIDGAVLTSPVAGPRHVEAWFSGLNFDVGPSNLAFTNQVYGNVAPQSITVTNTGDAPLVYTVQGDVFWLSVDNPTGVLAAGETATLTVRVATRGLAPRTYRGTLTITAPAAMNSPETVTVRLQIGAVSLPTLVATWGDNSSGQRNVPAGLTDAVGVSGGEVHSLALRANGTVVAWGGNGSGQINVPAGLTNAVVVAAGQGHSLALRADGTVAAWGTNFLGPTNMPVGLTNAVAIATKSNHSLVLRADGTVVAWGYNNDGQTNVPAGLSNVVAVTTGISHSLALCADGTVVAWGDNSYGQRNVPAGLTNAVAVAGGDLHSLALRADGTVVAWGANYYGQGNVPAGLSNAVAVAAGCDNSMALCADGTVVAWGDNTYGQTSVPMGLTSVVAAACGYYHSLVLAPAVSLFVNSTRGVPTPTQGMNWEIRNALQSCSVVPTVVQGTTQYVVAGWTGTGSVPASGTSTQVSFVITTNSTIAWLWTTNYWLDVGTSGCGSVGPGSGWFAAGSNVILTASNWPGYPFLGWRGDTNACTITATEITVPVTRARKITAQFDGTGVTVVPSSLTFSAQNYGDASPQVFSITNPGAYPLNYSIGSDMFWLRTDSPGGVLAPGASTTHVVRVATRGLAPRVYKGRVTITAPLATNSPCTVPVDLRIEPVVAPPARVVAWGGQNIAGELNVPVGLTNAVAVAGGANFALSVNDDGTVTGWGDDWAGELNVPGGLRNAVAVAAGWDFSLALRADGTVVGWGQNDSGQSSAPAGITNAVAIAAGTWHSMALCANGTVAAWGDNHYGQTNVPTGLTNAVAVAGGYFSLALRSDGTVVAWGFNNDGQTNVPVDLTNAVAVAGGWRHAVALRSDGRVTAWGLNSNGQTNVPADLTNAVAVAAGQYHSLALRSDGTIVVWGDNSKGQMNIPASLSNVQAIAGGTYHSLAVVPMSSLCVDAPFGSPVPARGTNWFTRNTLQTCSVDPVTVVQGATQRVFAGWTGTGSTPASGISTQVSFTITNNSSVSWWWATNYWLDVQSRGCGSVGLTSGWYAARSNVTVTASNRPDCTFLGWSGDTNGCAVEGTTITVPVTGPKWIQAQFTAPLIGLASSNLVFSGQVYDSIAPQVLAITNTGDGVLSYTIRSDMFWLSVDSPTGVLATGIGTSLVVRVATRGLQPRLYGGNLTIADPSASNSPQAVAVSLQIVPAQPPSRVVAWGDDTFGQTNVPSCLTDAVAVAAGGYHSLSLCADGTVMAWGKGGNGQTNVPLGLTDVAAVAGGTYHSLALRANGMVVAWGANDFGQTTVPAGLTNATAVAGGGYHSLAVSADGTVMGWGDDSFGQRDGPAGLSNAVAAAGGGAHSLALCADGTVMAWGDDEFGQTDVPAALTDAVAVAAGEKHSLALRADGSVVAWGDDSLGQIEVSLGLTDVVAVAAGPWHSLALRANGSVVTWGDNGLGQTSVPAGLKQAVAAAGGGGHSLALVPMASLVVTSPYGVSVPDPGTHWLTRNTDQACSVNPAVVVQGPTQYVCTGWSGSGSVPGSGTSNVTAFTITNNSVLAWLWTTNYWLDLQSYGGGDIGPGSGWYAAGSNVVLTASNWTGQSFLGWKGDTNGCTVNGAALTVPGDAPRRIEAWFSGLSFAVAPSGLVFSGQAYGDVAPQLVTVTNTADVQLSYTIRSDAFWLSVDGHGGVLAPGAGTTHVVRAATRGLAPRVYKGRLTITAPAATNSPCAVPVSLRLEPLVTPPSLVVAWGYNSDGQTNVPAGLTDAVAVAGGRNHSLALRADGTAVAWGSNSAGQTNVPTGLTNAVAVACGGAHSLALLADGTTMAWGSNSSGQTNVPAGLMNAVAVAGGDYHSVALRADGTVAAWGYNGFGQTTVPPGLTNAVAVDAGLYDSAALRADGTVVVWGDNSSGQTNVPAGLTNAVAVAAGDKHLLALCADGTVVAWGDNSYGQTNVPAGLTNAVAVAGGGYHSLAMRADGTVVAWGYGAAGRTNVPPGLTNAMAVAGGGGHSLALVPMASLVVTSPYGVPSPDRGTNLFSRPTPLTCRVDPAVLALGTTQYVCAGWIGAGDVPTSGTSNQTSFTISTNSAISWQWTTNYWLDVQARGCGNAGPGSGWCAAGSNVTLTASNWNGYTFVGWSGDTNGCVTNGLALTVPLTGARQIQARFTQPIMAVAPASLVFTGQVFGVIAPQNLSLTNAGDGPLNYAIGSDAFWLSVNSPTGVLAAGAGRTQVVRVATRGLAPRTYQGRLRFTAPGATNSPLTVAVSLQIAPVTLPSLVMAWGDGTAGQTNVPPDLTNAVAVAGGRAHSVVLRADGTVVAWGDNSLGQTNVATAPASVLAVSAGDSHSLAVCADGSVVAWGDDALGQTDVPANLTNAVAVAAGGMHSVGVRADGTVVTWGDNSLGQTNTAAGLTNALAVAAGHSHSVALRGNGTVVAWGDGSQGQTNTPSGLTNAVAVVAGDNHSLALRADGTVVAWGSNAFGQTNVPAGLTNAVAVAAGGKHSLALRADGTVVAWGTSDFGQTNVPTGLTNVVAVAAGRSHSLVLAPAARLVVSSPCGVAAPAQGTNWVVRNASQVCRVDPVILVQGTTQYVCTGWTGTGCAPAGGASNRVAFVITNDSGVVWHWNTNYRLDVSASGFGGVGPTSGWYAAGTNITVTASNWPGYVFLGWDGDTNDCTPNGQALSVPVTGSRQIHARFTQATMAVAPLSLVFSGQVHDALAPQSIGLTNAGDGPLYYTIRSDAVWLNVDSPTGTLAAGAGVTPVVRVATRGLTSRAYLGRLTFSAPPTTNSPLTVAVRLQLSAVSPPSLVMAWGSNTSGQTNVPAGLTNAVDVAGGSFHSLALRGDGKVAAWGGNGKGQTNVPPGLADAVAVSAELTDSLALRSNGTVMAWGDNSLGQTNVPAGLTNIVAMAGGGNHAVVLRADGTVAAWGSNSNGQTNVPAGLTNMMAVAGGGAHSLALRSDGTVAAWGSNSNGQTNVPAGLTNAVAVAAGQSHSVALRADGTLVAWGDNTYGQTNVPVGLTNVVAVAGGSYHSFAVREDGTVAAWGFNSFGQTNVPLGLTRAVAVSGGQYHSLALAPLAALIVTSPYGAAVPAQGTNRVIRGTLQTCQIDPMVQQGTTQYVSSGWSGAGSTPAGGASNGVSFIITNDSVLAWVWTTNYWLDIAVTSHGRVAPTSGWYGTEANLQLQATADPYYHFDCWTGTVTFGADTVSLPVTRPETVVACFAENLSVHDTPEWWLALHGLTNRTWSEEALDDQDHDGMPTWCEWASDTDPLDSNSVLRIVAIVPGTNGMRVDWGGGTGTWQYLERLQHLGQTGEFWTAIFTNVPPTGITTTRIDAAATNGAFFYRIRTTR